MQFDAKNFSGVANTDFGQELWDFITKPESRIRLITATELNRPAVEGIATPLLERFGDPVRDHQVRRMIGVMVKQVLKEEGYTIKDQGIHVRTGNVFSTGTRYKRDMESRSNED